MAIVLSLWISERLYSLKATCWENVGLIFLKKFTSAAFRVSANKVSGFFSPGKIAILN